MRRADDIAAVGPRAVYLMQLFSSRCYPRSTYLAIKSEMLEANRDAKPAVGPAISASTAVVRHTTAPIVAGTTIVAAIGGIITVPTITVSAVVVVMVMPMMSMVSVVTMAVVTMAVVPMTSVGSWRDHSQGDDRSHTQ